MYEGLMLAVAQSGEISGYYRESQGEGVTKTCSVLLIGQGDIRSSQRNDVEYRIVPRHAQTRRQRDYLEN